MRSAAWLGVLGACALVAGAPLCAPQGAALELPALRAEASANIELVANSGFEDPEAKGWYFSDWPPRKDTGAKLIAKSVFYSQDVAHSGKRALCFDLTTVGEDRILLAQQKLSAESLAQYDGRRMRLSAWVWLAQGPPGYQGGLTMRQWGASGTPPLSSVHVRLPATRGQWRQCATEFTLRMGETRRADVGVGMRQVPDLTGSPIIFVDDVKLEALTPPDLSAELLCGRTLFSPDDVLPVKVEVSDEAWQAGLRQLRWNVTSPDGRRSYEQGDVALASKSAVVEVSASGLPEGSYAARLAIGAAPGERRHEVLLTFRRAEGPFGR